MARITKSLVQKQFKWTNECWRKAIVDTYRDVLWPTQTVLSVDELTRLLNPFNRHASWRPQVHEVYLEHMVKLDTNKIEVIIETYNKGKFPRSPTTIDVLLTELFERAMKSKRGTR